MNLEKKKLEELKSERKIINEMILKRERRDMDIRCK